jgi:precorrin-3B synthase
VPETSPAASGVTARPDPDRCPGVLRLTEAADGFLARIRLPGGLVTAAQLRVLARLATALGDGRAELTSRGNVQLRGLAPDAGVALTAELTAAGLLPSLAHDRVRNILASPLAGLDRGRDLTGLVRALDAELCARPRLAELPGRFLFAIDDGRGDVAGLGADVTAVIGTNIIIPNGLALSAASSPDSVVGAMLACAEAFLDERAAHGGSAWRIADLPGGPERVRDAVAERLGLPLAPAAAGPLEAAAGARPAGLVRRGEAGGAGEAGRSVTDDAGYVVTAAVLLAPLGRLAAPQLAWLADRSEEAGAAARVTPWRSVVLPGPADAAGVLRAAEALGFGVDSSSPWLRVTACAGRPGCAHALADVQADALSFARRWPGRIVHVSGCARHCGRPAATEIDVTATSEGYEIVRLHPGRRGDLQALVRHDPGRGRPVPVPRRRRAGRRADDPLVRHDRPARVRRLQPRRRARRS